jgi:hypothetical protein
MNGSVQKSAAGRVPESGDLKAHSQFFLLQKCLVVNKGRKTINYMNYS